MAVGQCLLFYKQVNFKGLAQQIQCIFALITETLTYELRWWNEFSINLCLEKRGKIFLLIEENEYCETFRRWTYA